MHIKVPINVVSADLNVDPKYLKPLSPDIQVRYLLGHVYMFGKDIGTVMHLKRMVIMTFVFRVVCYIAQCSGCVSALI